VASHGYAHRPVYTLTLEQFLADVRRGVAALEDVIGERVRGYRAPYFSITKRARWALRALAQTGLHYDASTFPIHRRYYRFPNWDGWPEAERFPYLIGDGDLRMVEIPTTTVRVCGQNLPFAGGAFLRLVPFGVLKAAVNAANAAGHPAVFYLHPHDLDADELRDPLPNETLRMRLIRWALNVGRRGNANRLRRLLQQFPFGTVQDWLATRADLMPEATPKAVVASKAANPYLR